MIPGFFSVGTNRVSPPTASLYSLILAASPSYYFRHAEPSGTTMVNEVGSNGTYTGGTVTLGSTALYSGGPTSVRIPASGNSGFGQKTGGTLPAMTAMTLMTIVQFTSLSSGLRGLINCDSGASNRQWQWRMNGTTMEFVKIVGGVSVPSFVPSISTGTPYMLHITITSGGSITFYVNGVSAHTASMAAVDYGSVSEFIEIGFASAGVGLANAFFSESAIFPSALSGAQITAMKTAAGF